MLRFLRDHFTSHHATASVKSVDYLKEDTLQEYVHFSKLMCHGFPQRASCFCVDSELGILALGTRDGRIRVVGSEQVEWSGYLSLCSNVTSISFVSGKGILMVVSDNQHTGSQNIHRIRIDHDRLDIVTTSPPGYMKRINASVVVTAAQQKPFFVLGTVSGNLYHFNIDELQTTELVVYDDLMENEASALEPGQRAITCLHSEKNYGRILLVVISNMFLIVYDHVNAKVLHRLRTKSPIASAEFSYPLAEIIIIGHVTGGYSTYHFTNDNLVLESEDVLCYGPSAALPISKISMTLAQRNSPQTIAFSGGLPKVAFGDRYSVTVKTAEGHAVLDFDSQVISFEILHGINALFVLCEHELAAFDLLNPGFKLFPTPYLYPVHFSPVTVSMLIANVNEKIYLALCDAGVRQIRDDPRYTTRLWPLTCGASERSSVADLEYRECTVLITGHENGRVVFWKANSINMKPLLIYDTAKDFEGYEIQPQRQGDSECGDGNDDWPPFKKTGLFETFCDDPRFAIQRIVFDKQTGHLIVGGRSGHVLIYELNFSSQVHPIQPLRVIEVDMLDSIKTKANKNGGLRNAEKPLPPRKTSMVYAIGYRPSFGTMIQLLPSVAIHTLAFNFQLKTVAIGIEFGYIVVNLSSKAVVYKASLLPAEDIVHIVNNDGHLSRFKSMKRTLRQSFRRRRRPVNEEGGDTATRVIEEVRPVEREISARPKNAEYNVGRGDVPPSSVRLLKFAKIIVGDNSEEQHVLFVGTSGGVVYIHKMESHKLLDQVTCVMLNEIRLRHESPIINVEILHDHVLIFTEEQIRCFSLPNLKSSRMKYKITAVEGSRISKVQLVELRSAKNRESKLQFFAVLSTRGEIYILSPQSLKKLTKMQFTKAADGVGINSATLASDGTLFWLRTGGSEYQRATIATCANYSLISPFREHTLI